jgi:hypothetical protein
MDVRKAWSPKVRAASAFAIFAVLLAGCASDTAGESAQAPTTGRVATSNAPASTSTIVTPTTKPCPRSTSKARRAASTSVSALTNSARQHFARFQGCPWASRVREVEVMVTKDEIANLDHRELVIVTDAGPETADDELSAEDRPAVIELCKAGAAWGRVNLGRDPALNIVHDRQYVLLSRSDNLARPNCPAL